MDNTGILDPDGINLNPLNGKPYSDEYKNLAKKWKTFPVYLMAREIIKDINDNQVILLQSETGSGKSVIIPKLVLHTFNYDGKIAMTLPKQIIAKSAAEFAAVTLDVVLGEEIGYQYKGSPSNAKSDKTKILYATDGTIRARLLKDVMLSDYDCVIIDEAHERSVQIDFLIYLLRETLRLRPEFKLIIMSATVNAEIFRNYYSEFKFKQIDVGGGRTFPIESKFLDKNFVYNELVNEGFKILISILENEDMKKPNAHDIMFFITSSNEAFNLCRMLNQHLENEKKNKCKITCDGDVYCVEVFSGMDPQRQTLAQDKDQYKDNTNYNRKVVIATNVAESSLTIDGIKYVIDTGYELKSSYDVENRAKKLDRQLITHAQAKQRMGRAGRTEPGICYHLYTKNDFESNFKKFPEPDIRISDITGECLQLISNETIKTADKLINILVNFIEPPRENYIKMAISTLMQFGAIENNEITAFGQFLNTMPTNDIYMGVILIFARLYNCQREILKIIAITDVCKNNVSDLYNMPATILKKGDLTEEEYKKRLDSLEKRLNDSRKKFVNKHGDHLSLLKLYDAFIEYNDKHKNTEKMNDWLYKYFIKLNTMLKIKAGYKLLKGRMYGAFSNKIDVSALGITFYEDVNKMDIDHRILFSLMMGLRFNTASKTGDMNIYRTQHSNDKNIKISKMSFIIDKLPKNVFYNELFVMMGKSELNIVSEIPKSIIKMLS